MSRRPQLAILLVGALALLALAASIAWREPSPGPLARAHAAVPELGECEACHAGEGVDAGCLGCHVEIAAQREGRRGLHATFGAEKCANCHPEHMGESFDLLGSVAWRGEKAAQFRHPHVEFALEGRHDALECSKCHDPAPRVLLKAFPSHPREGSFLGATQACEGCHKDPHEGTLGKECTSCHTQEAFRPASGFRHDDHAPLRGAHREAACNGCHAEGNVWNRLKGTRCADCHETVHEALSADCASCHEDGAPWAKGTMTAEAHAAAGFPLAAPHDRVDCAKCHDPSKPYGDRYRKVAPGDCRSCHADPHGGQFRSSCTDCHAPERFQPHLYTRERHVTFDLRGAHGEADCALCHKRASEKEPRRFEGTPRTCRACHTDPHAGQFAKSECSACHGEERFLPSTYSAARHDTFALKNSHTAVACILCHRKPEGEEARRFEGTPRTCAGCHQDPHGRQFGAKACDACHRGDATTFRIRRYEHRGWRLDGAHETAACDRCHVERDGVRRYEGTPTECAACHADAHRGQFRVRGTTRCEKCHTSTEAWGPVPIDHDRETSFPLDGTHAKLDCAACHKPVEQPDGARVVQYRPLGKECKDCHGPSKRR